MNVRVHVSTAIFVLAAAFSFSPHAAAAQRREIGPESGYDRNSEVTLEGTVEAIEEHTGSGRGMMTGLHLQFATEEGTFEVHLGPSSFLSENSFQVEEGEVLTITGSRLMMAGSPSILARQVIRGDETLQLRDEAGRPRWAGMRGQRR